MTKSLVVARSVLLLQSITHAFNTAFVPITSNRSPIQQHQDNYATVGPTKKQRVVTAINAASSADNSPDAFMQYMAKSHEEKLRAVKDAEDRKNIEIQALKKQLEEAKAGGGGGSSSSIVAASNADGSSLEELSIKLSAYQTFMSSYIVNAQEEKRKAIVAAEEAITRKYEDKLAAFLLKGASDTNGVSLPAAQSKAEAPTIVEIPPEVIEADHGLRADGSVGGLTLAERVLQGAGAQSTVTADPLDETDHAMHPMEKLYFERNANVSAAAKAGAHNRWGSAEEILAAAKSGPGNMDAVGPLVLPPTPEPLPPSTELVNESTADTTTPASLYYKRTARIATAADAGVHNRWLSAEEEVAKDYITNALVAGVEATSVYVVPPEVEEADHGLRADGGVGGPSLADRVNLGAQLLNA